MRITSYSLHAVELPFKGAFEHAAKARESSSSLFLELTLEDGSRGWGEALPRDYVTGETLLGTGKLLSETILPKLLGTSFDSFPEVVSFLTSCDGQAPADWLPPETPQSAAWCAVDLALLDAFGKHHQQPPFGRQTLPNNLRYSGVLTSKPGLKQLSHLLAYRVLGFNAIKLKIDASTDPSSLATLQRRAGNRIELRADVNMAWSLPQAHGKMPDFARYGIRSFEQPLPADQLDAAAELVSETGLDIMADESLNTRASLDRLVNLQACTAINARISKCGGLIATLARCRQAKAAGLWVQIGCQVGESSLLSAAHLHLCAAFPDVRYAEGCFGKLLLKHDPAAPLVQFKRGGRPPALPNRPGIGVELDRDLLSRYSVQHWKGSLP